ncbi:fatty-acid oxidation protein subunit alpha [Marinobacter panjinensis]|uniref:enoyl-CoA hydratase n=1 Tax=Marinobacter panjinensis TaxID=2576384 RepID=A0A4U6R3Z4_9GAMM|nr:3-hydroxyacyl-CoA dehydrogenase NAD-binding domain-containing protein [Marinobacter panjinensis]MCR8913127.1 3-hydroxyacyl-CoA dehydrogenase NAD-binding domain-containing protein [Marinobacter panjinensis]TKV68181.1 fatty-acid oxidation protein subunit alpha [Marinobacter panjinensis]
MTGHILKALSAREMARGPFENADTGTQAGKWQHWHLARDDKDVAWLIFDKKDAAANVLSAGVLEELGRIVEELESKPPKGLVLRSTKPTGFCLGADISEFSKLESEAEVVDKLTEAHEVVDRLEALSFPTIAVIHGSCLGGGLELALACDYRFAIPGAKLGFPEVQLGLHPGLGGTARFTQLVDPIEAMTMMLTGKTAPDFKAKKLGLVDQIVEERHVGAAVEAAIAGEIEQSSSGMRGKVLSTKPARQLQTRQMRSQAAKKAPPQHYPAPEALIELWEQFGGDSGPSMRKEEIASFARLMMTDTSRNLVKVFFLREKMKGLTRTGAEPVKHVHVVGAGAMGADIAGWCAFQGLSVTLFDMEPEKLAAAVGKLSELCETKHRSESQRRDILDRLTPDFANRGVEYADLVIEAVPEKADIKQKVYEDVEPRLKQGAILATNTSSIPLETLGEKLKDPKRLVGLHFFNPVALMPLVEVVNHDQADKKVLDRALAFVGQIDRLPAPVETAPGFLVNRALTPYLVEAMVMLDEGVPAESIDRVAEEFGMPMGPIELADQVGLDICLSVADMLRERLDTDMPPAPDWLRQKVEDGKLGKKSGEGLYQWKKGKADKQGNTDAAPDGTLDRLLLPMLNACMACLREGVIEDEALADGAMIFGTGFAPFRGGPMNYAHNRGFDDIRESLESLANSHGDRFKPDAGWLDKGSPG